MKGTRRQASRREELARLRQAVKAAGIKFPFVRGKSYPLRDLKVFEEMLAKRRRRRKTLSNALREPAACPWVKVRNNELIPLEYFAEHKGLGEEVTFCLMPEGSDVDIVIGNDGITARLQVTTTGPVWSRQDGSKRDWGYDQHLMMRKLNATGAVGGFGPFEEREGGIANREEALATEEIVVAFAEGLSKAFEKKARLRTLDCELVVHVVGCEKFPEKMFQDIVMSTAAKVRLDNFTRVHVLGSESGYYVQVR
jgi:hypothetical protein